MAQQRRMHVSCRAGGRRGRGGRTQAADPRTGVRHVFEPHAQALLLFLPERRERHSAGGVVRLFPRVGRKVRQDRADLPRPRLHRLPRLYGAASRQRRAVHACRDLHSALSRILGLRRLGMGGAAVRLHEERLDVGRGVLCARPGLREGQGHEGWRRSTRSKA